MQKPSQRALSRRSFLRVLGAVLTLWLMTGLLASPLATAEDPLPSWNAGAVKTAIVDFVTAVTLPDGAEFVPAEERIAVFDNDGTLWVEQRIRDGVPVLVRLPEIAFIDDKAGKPVGINTFIGRRPIAAFGNSDGDLQMLQWTTSAPGRRFGLIVHHDDAQREYAYDRQSHIGRLDKALDAASASGWAVVSMKSDWRIVFPPE